MERYGNIDVVDVNKCDVCGELTTDCKIAQFGMGSGLEQITRIYAGWVCKECRTCEDCGQEIEWVDTPKGGVDKCGCNKKEN